MFKLILEMFFLYLVLFPPGGNITTSVSKTIYFYLYLGLNSLPKTESDSVPALRKLSGSPNLPTFKQRLPSTPVSL